MEDIHVQIGSRVRELREKQGMSRTEVADMLGLTTDHYGNIERGIKRLRLESIIELCALFHVSLDNIILGTEKEELLNQDALVNFYAMFTDNERKLLLSVCKLILSRKFNEVELLLIQKVINETLKVD